MFLLVVLYILIIPKLAYKIGHTKLKYSIWFKDSKQITPKIFKTIAQNSSIEYLCTRIINML